MSASSMESNITLTGSSLLVAGRIFTGSEFFTSPVKVQSIRHLWLGERSACRTGDHPCENHPHRRKLTCANRGGIGEALLL